ncbi:MAG: hypothetical protein OXQ29_08010 [Rhodospirillaceae bacterium]|nr:hypothetical protein [Rhodospirillaceae bacterium]
MKLRILGNSLRLRVSQAEMSQIRSEGVVRQHVRFAPGRRLAYELRTVTGGRVSASFDEECIRVTLPRAVAERWQEPDEVSIRGEQQLPGGECLRILVEKDFQCLVPRNDEDQSGLFPNPQQSES